jgi:hypothetical protein
MKQQEKRVYLVKYKLPPFWTVYGNWKVRKRFHPMHNVQRNAGMQECMAISRAKLHCLSVWVWRLQLFFNNFQIIKCLKLRESSSRVEKIMKEIWQNKERKGGMMKSDKGKKECLEGMEKLKGKKENGRQGWDNGERRNIRGGIVSTSSLFVLLINVKTS